MLITFSRCALNVVCIEMNARVRLVAVVGARLRIDKSVFQVGGIVRASAEQAGDDLWVTSEHQRFEVLSAVWLYSPLEAAVVSALTI